MQSVIIHTLDPKYDILATAVDEKVLVIPPPVVKGLSPEQARDFARALMDMADAAEARFVCVVPAT